MRIVLLGAFVVAAIGCVDDDAALVAVRAPPAAPSSSARDAYGGCFARTSVLLDRADEELGRGATAASKASVTSAEATFAEEDRERACPTDAHERVRARRILLRGLVERAARSDDLDVLASLGDESFQSSQCEPALTARCAEHAAWLRARFPSFADGFEVRIKPLFRLPITPQPDGRLTVEYMDYVQQRIETLDSDVFALEIEPSTALPVDSSVELRVDGSDVIESPVERKTGAHLAIRVPATDLARARGSKSLVVIVNRRAFVHAGATWRATARFAYGE